MKALDKIKDMIDFCDAVGCHRALYESLKAVESELEALQQPKNNCDTCKWDDYCGTEENCLSSKYIKDRYEPKLKEQ